MNVEELTVADGDAATALWELTGLTRPWNSPRGDFERALAAPSSTVLGVRHDSELVATVMVGSDGHRGWIYYLAVDPVFQRRGLATRLMRAAEEWLLPHNIDKVHLMVRDDNVSVRAFYEKIGYTSADVSVLTRKLRDPRVPEESGGSERS